MEPQEKKTGLTLKKLQCPQCGAALEVKNAPQARALHCAYCNSSISLKGDEAAILARDVVIYPPKSGLKIGAVADFKQGKYQIIGRVHYRDLKLQEWDEWQLLAESGEYLWLVEDDWDFIIMQKFTPEEPFDPEKARYYAEFEGQRVEVEDYSKATILFFEGELTWGAQAGDTVSYLDAWKGEETLYSVEWEEREIQYFKGWEKDVKDIYKAFNITEKIPEAAFDRGEDDDGDSPRISKGVYTEWALKLMRGQVFWITLAAGIVFLLIGWWMSSSSGALVEPRLYETISEKEKEITVGPLEVRHPRRVHKLSVEADLNNDEMYCEFNLLDEKKEPVGSFDYTFWQESSSEWEPFDNTSNLRCIKRFVPLESGTYYLQIEPEKQKRQTFQVSMYDRSFSPTVFFILGGAAMIYPAGIILAWSIVSGYLFIAILVIIIFWAETA